MKKTLWKQLSQESREVLEANARSYPIIYEDIIERLKSEHNYYSLSLVTYSKICLVLFGAFKMKHPSDVFIN